MDEESRPTYKRLYRSNEDRVMAGVCGGFGEYFEVDPVLIRLIFIILGIFGGSGVILYILAWILVPRKPWRD